MTVARSQRQPTIGLNAWPHLLQVGGATLTTPCISTPTVSVRSLDLHAQPQPSSLQ